MAADLDPDLLARALGAIDEGIQVLSPDLRYLYLNAAAARHGRKPIEELLGRTMRECYPGIEQTAMFARLERCLRAREPATMENEFTYEDGARAWFELRIRPFERGLVVVSLDVTARKSIELRLEEAYRQALRDLMTPVLRVHDGVLLVPIVGALENARAERMTEDVLSRTAEVNAKVVIFDVAALPSLDAAVGRHLVQTTAMIRLLGAKTILTGLAMSTARALVRLGVDLSGMQTTSRLSEGLDLALAIVR